MNPVSGLLLVYLGIGLVTAGAAFGATWLTRTAGLSDTGGLGRLAQSVSGRLLRPNSPS